MGKARQSNESPDLATLLQEIVQNTETLLSQQFDLLRSELKQEIRQARDAAASLGAGAGMVAAGGILTTLMAVHALHMATGLPLWTCYGLVGGALAAGGGKLLVRGWKEITNLQFPPPQTTEALKENLAWIKKETAPAAT